MASTHCCFLELLDRELRRQNERFARFLPLGNSVRRYCGDLANAAPARFWY